jgi:hypothetical protein
LDLLSGPADYLCTGKCPDWQSGLKTGVLYFRPVLGNRSYWGTFDPLFSDYGYSGRESEIADFAGRKTGLIIPFWMADRLFYGLEQGNGKKACFRVSVFGDLVCE